MRTLGIFIILNVLSFCCFAQSKHTSVWNRDNYVISFDANTVHIEDNDDFFDKKILYVDSKGEIKLVLDFQGLLLNSHFEPIKGGEKVGDEMQFVVPAPHNCNFVYFFGAKRYVLIDVEKSEIVGDVMTLNELDNIDEYDFIEFNYILVHHSNCKDIWLIYYSNDIMYKYLITTYGVEYKETVYISRQITNPLYNKDMIIRLSNDCKHYSANFFCDSIVCYGDFDRKTGNFVRKSEVIMRARPEVETTKVLNSCISNDNKTIYYYCESTVDELDRFKEEILSADIVDGKPDYENVHILYSATNYRAGSCIVDMLYGNDGNIYISNFYSRKLLRIIPSGNGKTIVDGAFLNFSFGGGTRSDNFLADWFSQNPCGENCACPDIEAPVIICD